MTEITGNWPIVTQGTASIKVSGANGVVYANNFWDKPPTAQISAGPGAATHGAFSGFFTIGSTNPTTTATFTLPWVPYGAGGGACGFQAGNGVSWAGGPTGTPPAWALTFASDVHGQNVSFNCPGQQ